MSRLQYAGLALALLLVGSALLWWTLGRPETTPPSRQSIETLTDTVSVGWTAQETAVIEASSSTDALTALGYVHGMTRSWLVTVWRRTALGTLSAQFGEELVPLDRHARRLGFARHAREAYDELPTSVQQRLRAYVRGLNAALQSEPVRHRAPFLFFDLAPQRWAPWHPLAIERLLAWMGTDLPTPPGERRAVASDFRSTDRLLRHWLHLHGGTRSVAWAARASTDTTRTALFTRHVLGASADPLLQEVTIRRPGAPPLVAASLPGAPLFPTGTTGARAWTYLLGSPTRLDSVEMDSTRIRDWHERITPRDGDEQLVRVRRHGTALILTPPSLTPDSAWVLRWPGFRTRSDVPTWLNQANLGATSDSSAPPLPPSHIMHGTGLTVDSTGDWTVQGRPPVVERSQHTVLVGRSSWARFQAEGLRAHQPAATVDPARWSASDSSTWAATLLPRLLPDLAPLAGTDSIVDDALSYLRNWNYVYESSSISAVLFERWIRAYRAEIGRMPSVPDSTFFAAPRRRQTFRRAVDTLVARYGTDVRRWRWERAAPDRRHFLVWSADSLSRQLSGLEPLSTTRFAPLDRPGRGHPSALAGGPTLVDPLPLGPAPTQWEGWAWSGQSKLTVRRLRFDPSAFFARSRLPQQPSGQAPVSVSQASVTATTQLVPARP